MTEKTTSPDELGAAPGSESHPAMQRTWWMNLYPNGQCTGTLCETRDSALNRCTYTDEIPDAIQVEVRITPVDEHSLPRDEARLVLALIDLWDKFYDYNDHPRGCECPLCSLNNQCGEFRCYTFDNLQAIARRGAEL